MPPPGSGVPAAAGPNHGVLVRLAGHASSTPHRPWLVFRDQLDWRWRSYAQTADHVARGAAVLAAQTISSSVVFDAALTPDQVSFELAVQAAGKRAVPRRGAAACPFPPVRDRLGSDALEALQPWVEGVDVGGLGDVVLSRGDERRVAGAADLEAAVSPLVATWTAGASATVEPGARKRPIVLLGGHLGQPAVEIVVAWSLVAGAVLALEPDAEALVATSALLRPTVVTATADQLAGLHAAAVDLRRWSRLRTVLTVEPTTPDSRWAALGVTVSPLPIDVWWSRLAPLEPRHGSALPWCG